MNLVSFVREYCLTFISLLLSLYKCCTGKWTHGSNVHVLFINQLIYNSLDLLYTSMIATLQSSRFRGIFPGFVTTLTASSSFVPCYMYCATY
ncbi:hypothetical protein RIF29_06963 [Crotalaria pallida]|uniref:Uncharacterized protein n=1 Tax=Crotalaria pallida TaxID=3830 RepID=A0AAN9PAL2_CROPI